MRKIQLVILLVAILGVHFSCGLLDGENDDGTRIGLPPPSYHEFPKWSSDGKTIMYYSTGLQLYDPETERTIHDKDSAGIWTMDTDGTNQLKILNADYANWSPDGQWIVYVTSAQIYKIRFNGSYVDTSSIVQLTFTGRNFFPNWSPDGQWIVYSQSICNEIKQCGVWLYNLETETEQFISKYGSYPHWHPTKNSFIYLTRGVTPNGEAIGDSLWTYTLNSSKANLLAFLEGGNRYPKYSPNGTMIAFSSNFQVWTMSNEAKGLKQLTFDERGTMPDWSPDGKQIIYSGPDDEIWVMDKDGSNQIPLTHRPDLNVMVSGLTSQNPN